MISDSPSVDEHATFFQFQEAKMAMATPMVRVVVLLLSLLVSLSITTKTVTCAFLVATTNTPTQNRERHSRRRPLLLSKNRYKSGASSSVRLYNTYDDFRDTAAVPQILPLSEENVISCLQEFVWSDYGSQMFGCHERAASIGITGCLDFVEIDGPEVILKLSGAFWHRRDTVLGRAAMWLNACIPEIVHVNVADAEELQDFEEIRDDYTGEVLLVNDKRSEDYNGDRGTMEYQGIDPDVRGPFSSGTQGFQINPA